MTTLRTRSARLIALTTGTLAASLAFVPTASAADTTAPTKPGNFRAYSSGNNSLAWDASTDNVAVTGYRIFRNGTLLTTVPGSVTSYVDAAITGGGVSYTYTVQADDAVGNVSPLSTAVTVESDPALRFKAGFVQTTEGVPEGGRDLSLHYDLSRLGQCRGTNWQIDAYYSIDGGPASSTTIANWAGVYKPSISTPAGNHTLAIWFKNFDASGCTKWDSKLGANYMYNLGAPVSINFAANFQNTVTGTLHRGRTINLTYNPARITSCKEYTSKGSRAHTVYVDYKFNGGPLHSVPLNEFTNSMLLDTKNTATNLELWFRVVGRITGCTAYDSNFGANYHFALVS